MVRSGRPIKRTRQCLLAFRPFPMDIYSENSGPVDMTGQSSSRPDESNPPRQSIHSADFKPTNSNGQLRASPTHFDDSSRGFGSQANPLHLPRPVATRSGESPTEGFGIPRRNDRSTVDWIVPLSNEEKNTNTTTNTVSCEQSKRQMFL